MATPKDVQILKGTGAVVIVQGGGDAGAAAKAAKAASSGGEGADGAKPPSDEDGHKVTRHTVTIGGAPVAYTARAGTMTLRDDGKEPKATVFFTAYTRDDVADVGSRPITYAFNGGPGSSSVWLHLGLFGPRRIHMPSDATLPPPPYHLIDNEHSILDVSDVVFIDPVSTGYSRAAEGEDAKLFHGVTEDVRWMAEFIRLYATRNGRWGSPTYLAGESYGTTRAAGLAAHLQDRHGLYLCGLMLISSILDFATAYFTPGNDLPYLLFLPTYAATAHYHRALPDDLQAKPLRTVLDEVEAFALGDYAAALVRGDRLSDAERDDIAGRVARYTGLSADYVRLANLRIRIGRFCKELLRARRTTVGRLDTRYTGHDSDAAGESFEHDPSYAAILGPYTATLNDYVRRELGYESDVPYEILTDRVHPWKFDTAENRFLNVATSLREAMTKNPHLRVYVANGYHDLATPYFATEYTFDHLGLEPHLKGNVSMGYFEAGHMMYVHEGALGALKGELAGFVGG
ncbi:MAG: peptidase S10 [Anaerolineae bacterium]